MSDNYVGIRCSSLVTEESCVTVFGTKTRATSVLAIDFHHGLKPVAQICHPDGALLLIKPSNQSNVFCLLV
jgi:hypothetical protein